MREKRWGARKENAINKQKKKYDSRKRLRGKIRRVKDGLSRIVKSYKDAGASEAASNFLSQSAVHLSHRLQITINLLLAPAEKLIS